MNSYFFPISLFIILKLFSLQINIQVGQVLYYEIDNFIFSFNVFIKNRTYHKQDKKTHIGRQDQNNNNRRNRIFQYSIQNLRDRERQSLIKQNLYSKTTQKHKITIQQLQQQTNSLQLSVDKQQNNTTKHNNQSNPNQKTQSINRKGTSIKNNQKMKKKINCYQQLQEEFNLVEKMKIDDQVEMQYEKLFNSLRSQTTKKKSIRDKRKLQRLSLHSVGSKLRQMSQRKKLQQSLSEQQNYSSNISGVNFMQKKAIINIQKQALMKQIDTLSKIVHKMNQDKIIAKQQLRQLNNKQAECASIINQLTGVLAQLQINIKQQKLINKQLTVSYTNRMNSLNKQLQDLKDYNITQSTKYKHAKQSHVQQHNIDFLGSILHWTNQENKIKHMEKKIYTKLQMENMLRALYIVGKLARSNYGNIIEHLIKISQSKKIITSVRNFMLLKKKSCNNNQHNINQFDNNDKVEIYTDVFGNQLPIKELIQKINSQLLSKAQLRLLSKQQIIQYYVKQGITLSSYQSATSTPNLSTPTQQMITKIIQHHEKLTSWFSRIQKRNQQLSQYYQSLLKVDDDLQKEITTIEMSSQQKSINYLQSREGEICRLEDRVRKECKVIFMLNLKMYHLSRRFTSLNKFFDKLVKQAEIRSKKYKKTYVGSEIDQSFLKSITKTLIKSPQNIILDWNKVIKNKIVDSTKSTTNRMSSSSDGLEPVSQNDAYYDTIMRNDLLRVYAQPSMYDSQKSYLQNLQSTFDYVMGEECVIMERLSMILKGLLMFAKQGIEQTGRENFFKESVEMTTRTQNTIDTKVSKQQQQTVNRLSPLLRLFQQSRTQPKLDKFFHKDAVKQQSNQTEHESDDQEKQKENQHYFQKQTVQNNEEQSQWKQQNLCVQSNDYYRRDDFKIIERLERLNMKKKGLLPKVPFFNDTTLEMELQQKKGLVNVQTKKQFFRPGTTKTIFRSISPRLSHPRFTTCSHLLSQRRERQCTRKRQLNQLLSNISTISLQNQKYRIKRKTTDTMLSSLSMSRLSYRGIK